MNLKDPEELFAFEDAYIVCMLWSSRDESRDDGGDPLDQNYGVDDIDIRTRVAITADCQRFCRMLEQELKVTELPGWTAEQAGHDFWLTRNGHGTGFWDRHFAGSPWESLGDWLMSKVGVSTDFPEQDPYVGDDGKIHIA